MLRDAVATDMRARLALYAETAKKIKKTNNRVDAKARQMRANNAKAKKDLQAMTAGILGKIAAERNRAKAALKASKSADAARWVAANKFLRTQVLKARKESNAKFVKAFNK